MPQIHGKQRAVPPSLWPGVDAAPLGGDVYWRGSADVGGREFMQSLTVWHWCTRTPLDPDDVEDGRWAGVNVARHDLVSREPLHLEPSLLWGCCGKHGWIRAGAWTEA